MSGENSLHECHEPDTTRHGRQWQNNMDCCDSFSPQSSNGLCAVGGVCCMRMLIVNLAMPVTVTHAAHSGALCCLTELAVNGIPTR